MQLLLKLWTVDRKLSTKSSWYVKNITNYLEDKWWLVERLVEYVEKGRLRHVGIPRVSLYFEQHIINTV